ncbi:MAG: hypothetical protein KGZ65_03510 [Sphingomonadales bacterium]|nr:hypothetical protein [Sphingomonadaceae bacterium]MBS3930277.1 hypothetical protein [Sphingomonadales bacterium]
MLETLQLQKLAREIVAKRMPKVEVADVLTVPITDSEGEAALRITFVLTPESVDAITGEDALKLLVELKDALFRKGEERFAIIEYATPDDLEEQEED